MPLKLIKLFNVHDWKTLSASSLCVLMLSACDGNKNTDTAMDTSNTEPSLAETAKEKMQFSAAELTESFSPRLSEPRIPPVDKNNLTDEQKEMLASRPDYNLYKTLAHHVELYNRWTPLGRVLLNNSTLDPRHREIIMLRMGWLCQAEYEWSQHARIATAENIGMTEDEILKIASDPDAASWTDFEKTLMDMVDELRYDTKVSDQTWSKLQEKYTVQEIMDAIFTAAQYQLVSMVLNSAGIQLDPILEHRLPTQFPLPPLAGMPETPRLITPRVPPVSVAAMSDEQKEIAKNQINDDGEILNLYGTMINHPALYGPRYTFGSYILRETSLPEDIREILIMRTGWLMQAEYEWAHHVPYAKEAGLSDAQIRAIAIGATADGWSDAQRAAIKAADELRAQAFITNDTWSELQKHFNTRQLVELVFTVGGYSMTALAINSLGIQVEPGYASFPDL